MTYSADGLADLSASNVKVIDIPVANGRTMQSLIHDKPITFFITFNVIAFVNFTIRLDPTAFGYSAFTSPLLPMP